MSTSLFDNKVTLRSIGLLFVFVLSISASAQLKINKSDLIGSWQKDMPERSDEGKDVQFKNSGWIRFSFQPDGNCTLIIDNKAEIHEKQGYDEDWIIETNSVYSLKWTIKRGNQLVFKEKGWKLLSKLTDKNNVPIRNDPDKEGFRQFWENKQKEEHKDKRLRFNGIMTIFSLTDDEMISDEGSTFYRFILPKFCISCNGTGSTTNEFAISLTRKEWCNTCGADRYVGHSHITCQRCNGKGTIDGTFWKNDSTEILEQNKRYRWIAEKVIEDNLKNKTVKGNLLFSSELLDTFVGLWKLTPTKTIGMSNDEINSTSSLNPKRDSDDEWFKLKTTTLEAFTSDYYSRQMVNDMTDIFWDYCHRSLSLEELETIKEEWLTIKTISIFNMDEVHDLFLQSLEKYMIGEFKGFSQPECTKTYITLFDQLYQMLSSQNAFEKDKGRVEGLYPKEKVEAFFSEQQRLLFMVICRRYISEKNLRNCIDYLNEPKKLATYEKTSFIAKDNAKEISNRLLDKYLQWIKKKVDLEPNNALLQELWADISAYKSSFMESDKWKECVY